MDFIIAGTIILTIGNLYALYKLRKEHKQYTKTKAKLKKQRDMSQSGALSLSKG